MKDKEEKKTTKMPCHPAGPGKLKCTNSIKCKKSSLANIWHENYSKLHGEKDSDEKDTSLAFCVANNLFVGMTVHIMIKPEFMNRPPKMDLSSRFKHFQTASL